jgi:pimeloyl-ACP methyl ester carboxylesterase
MVTVAPGVELEVLDWGGSGEPLVLLTGFGDNAHVFDNFAHQFNDRFHVYSITRRGFGASSKPSSDYDVDTRVKDYLAVLDELNIPSANFAGHSVAGQELSKLGSAHPDRVKKLVYLDAYEYGTYSKLPPLPTPELTDADYDSLNHYAAVFTRVLGVRRPNSALCNGYVFDSSGRIGESTTPPEVYAQVFANSKLADLEQIQAPALGIFNVNTEETKPPLYYYLTPAQQTEFEAAWKPQVAWQRDSVNRFRTLVKNSQVIELQNSDHYVYIHNEAEVTRFMRDFLRIGSSNHPFR